jgi:hypothetical protein
MGFYIKNGNNLTTQNFFTYVKLGKELKTVKIMIAGTVRPMRAEGLHFVKKSQRKLYEQFLLERDGSVLTVYQGKQRNMS